MDKAMVDINKVELRGRVGNVRSGQSKNGNEYFNVGIATEYKNNTTWHDCTAWGDTAITMSNNISKGDTLHIIGTILNDEYTDKNGDKKQAKKVLIFNVIGVEEGETNNKQEEKPQPKDDDSDDDDDGLPF